jgi:hypothetical protein
VSEAPLRDVADVYGRRRAEGNLVEGSPSFTSLLVVEFGPRR